MATWERTPPSEQVWSDGPEGGTLAGLSGLSSLPHGILAMVSGYRPVCHLTRLQLLWGGDWVGTF